jgi:hypothetical protein
MIGASGESVARAYSWNATAAAFERLYVNATDHPSASRRMAVTRPMPLEAPVMRTVRLLRTLPRTYP